MTGLEKGLKKGLDSLYNKYSLQWIETDPVCIPHKYTADEDIETAGFIAAVLAYGKVSLFLPKITMIMDFLNPSPYESLKNLNHKQLGKLDHFYYRFQTSDDIKYFLTGLSNVIKKHARIKNLFLEGYHTQDENILPALNYFILSFRKVIEENGMKLSHGLSHLIPMQGNGAMKRLNMFLRWMVRKDNIDFGIWKEIRPSQLIIPVDTHINRISGYLNLAKRKNADIKSAIEITNFLKKLSAEDPVKYDFALTRLGMYFCNSQNQNRCWECILKDYCVNGN
jgi:uncharacterized protein (TIGR02757 family)